MTTINRIAAVRRLITSLRNVTGTGGMTVSRIEVFVTGSSWYQFSDLLEPDLKSSDRQSVYMHVFHSNIVKCGQIKV